jgi:hypothetical protein
MSGTVFAKAPAVCGSSVPLFVMPGRGLHIDDADRPAYQCLSSYFSMVTRLMKPIGPKNLHMRPPPVLASAVIIQPISTTTLRLSDYR